MDKNWTVNIDKETLESELTFKEVMKLRGQCIKMYDALELLVNKVADESERPNNTLPEHVTQASVSCRIIMGHIDDAQKKFNQQ